MWNDMTNHLSVLKLIERFESGSTCLRRQGWLLFLQTRLVNLWSGCIDAAIPTILVKTVRTRTWYRRISSMQATANDRTTNASAPFSRISHGSYVVSIEHQLVPFSIVELQCQCWDVWHVGIWAIRNVDDQWSWRLACAIKWITAKKCGPSIQSQIDKWVLIWNRGKRSPIRNTWGVTIALIGSHHAGPVRPPCQCVCRTVNGEDNVDLAIGL